MSPVVLAGLLGIAQGARHALEPDHVSAVATVMVRAPSPGRGLAYAASWGLGHGTMLVLFGGTLSLLRIELPASVASALEIAVGAMLVLLGVRAFRQMDEHVHETKASFGGSAGRPFVIGLVHGLAGSGALVALIALGASSTASAIACLALYAIGTTAGMVALAAIAGPLLARAGRFPKVATMVGRVAGAVSILVGIFWVVRVVL